MNGLKQVFQQFMKMYQSMLPSQRATLLVVPLVVLGAFGVLLYQHGSTNYTAVSWGKVFTSEELIQAEQALIDEGLNDFERQGQRLMVPKGELERYTAALVKNDGLPSNWGEELEKQVESSNMFSTPQQIQTRKEVALAKQLRRIIRAIPDVEDGNVIWARSSLRHRFGSKEPSVTATVNVRPRRGREVSPALVRSLRMAVASMVSDLKPEHVTVLDQSTGTSYTADQQGDPYDNQLLTKIREFTEFRQSQINEALSYISNVLVAVNVDVENLKSSIERSQVVDPKGAVPLQTNERKIQEKMEQRPERAEPGQVANMPRTLQTKQGQQKTVDSSDETVSSLAAPSFTVTEKQFIAAMPNAIGVSVSIPDDYYRAVAIQRGSNPGSSDAEKTAFDSEVQKIRQEVEKNVQQQVAQLLPNGSPANAVSVSTYTRIETEPAEVTVPWSTTLIEFLSQWGSALALAVFAVWALRMVNKSLGAVSAVDEPEKSLTEQLAFQDHEEPEDEVKMREPTQRDHLQSLVRDNPEMAATVLQKWIQAAK